MLWRAQIGRNTLQLISILYAGTMIDLSTDFGNGYRMHILWQDPVDITGRAFHEPKCSVRAGYLADYTNTATPMASTAIPFYYQRYRSSSKRRWPRSIRMGEKGRRCHWDTWNYDREKEEEDHNQGGDSMSASAYHTFR